MHSSAERIRQQSSLWRTTTPTHTHKLTSIDSNCRLSLLGRLVLTTFGALVVNFLKHGRVGSGLQARARHAETHCVLAARRPRLEAVVAVALQRPVARQIQQPHLGGRGGGLGRARAQRLGAAGRLAPDKALGGARGAVVASVVGRRRRRRGVRVVGGVQARRILAVLPRPGREPGGPRRKRSALGCGGWGVVVQQRRVVVAVVEAAVADVDAPPGRRHVARAVAESGARLLLPVPVLGRLRGQAGRALRGRHLAPLRAGEGAAAAGPVPVQGALSLERPRRHRVLPQAALALPARLALGRPAGGSGRCRHDGRPAGVLPARPRSHAFRVPLPFSLSHRDSRGARA